MSTKDLAAITQAITHEATAEKWACPTTSGRRTLRPAGAHLDEIDIGTRRVAAAVNKYSG